MVDVLTLFKIDIGVSHNKRDTLFLSIIEASKKEIERKGINLDIDDIEDKMLLSDYSVWVYENRREDKPLAKNIDLRIKNRIVRERSNYEKNII